MDSMAKAQVDCTFRQMKEVDLPDVLLNERKGYTHPWAEGIFKDCIRSRYECWLILFESQVIGHGILSCMADEGHMLNICIHPDKQGKGLGRILVEFMLDRAKARNVRTIFLEVRASNLAAYELYMSLGFNEIGIRKNYYPAFIGREDAIVLAREILENS